MCCHLPGLVDRVAEHDSDRPAVRCFDERLTYGELVRQANGLATVLIDQGVRRGDRVGVLMNKSARCAIAIHGIMKAAGAYVPLDPSAPPSRLGLIARDCGIRHIVAQTHRPAILRETLRESPQVECVVCDQPVGRPVRGITWEQALQAQSDIAPDVGVGEHDLAYILYTSGSTGVPKGIAHTHHSGLGFAAAAATAYGFTHEDRVTNHAPLHFDLSTLDYFAAAHAGAATIVIPEMHMRIAASLSELIEAQAVTVLYCVPFALTQLLLHGALDQRDLSALRWVLFAGEPMPVKHLRGLMAELPHTRFANIYGPTETNGCTHYIVPPTLSESDEPLPIGQPYPGTEALVVDAADNLVPPGEPGELLIHGPTTMLEYWQRPDLTAERTSRVDTGDGEKAYHRTGDLVRIGPDGNFAFLGRKDRQVKVRGHRVELDEIEAVLSAHPLVSEAAAYTVPSGDGTMQVIAAVTSPDGQPDPAELARFVGQRLPPYAVPSRIEIRETFPRTSTGKLDRLRLEQLGSSAADTPPTTQADR